MTTLHHLAEAELAHQQSGEVSYVPDPHPEAYAISGIDGLPKDTDKLRRCLAVVLVGKDFKGRNISQLLHVSPKILEKSIVFVRPFKRTFQKILTNFSASATQCEVLVYGGVANDSLDPHTDYRKTNADIYREMLELLTECSRKILKSNPQVKAGPNGNFKRLLFVTETKKAVLS